MSEEAGQKSHAPTERKLDEARRKGDVAISGEVRHAAMLAAIAAAVGGLGSLALARLATLSIGLWGGAGELSLSPAGAHHLAGDVLAAWGRSIGPLLAALLAAPVVALLLQGRPGLAWSRVSPRWSRLSPAAGLKRLFGTSSLVEFGKTLAKLAGVTSAVFLAVSRQAPPFAALVGADPLVLATVAGKLVFQAVKAAAILVAALALVDFAYQHRAFFKRMQMSDQELKDEHKQNEGDPNLKARRRAIGQQRARRRMLAAVPTASVVITNPTHYAVALKYDHGAMAAPVVVAKGMDKVALRIREAASKAGVPVVESPPLARALHASVEIDRPISVEHYAAVAEIVGYVMRLASRR